MRAHLVLILMASVVVLTGCGEKDSKYTLAGRGEPQIGDIVVTVERGPLQDGPRTVAALPKGARLQVVKLNGDWIGCLVLVNGKEEGGWIRKWLVAKENPAGNTAGSHSAIPASDEDAVNLAIVMLLRGHSMNPIKFSERLVALTRKYKDATYEESFTGWESGDGVVCEDQTRIKFGEGLVASLTFSHGSFQMNGNEFVIAGGTTVAINGRTYVYSAATKRWEQARPETQ